ncbi:hypothetical protein DXZ75_40605 [Streptomyces sp. AcE210]|nr:hypothetical protein DXZ75_40605 [Streptomyces sp. AcE210]
MTGALRPDRAAGHNYRSAQALPAAICGSRATETVPQPWWVSVCEAHEMPRPEIVLGFHGLCLVKPLDDGDWYMGSLYDNGSIDCWTAYGDLCEALRGL